MASEKKGFRPEILQSTCRISQENRLEGIARHESGEALIVPVRGNSEPSLRSRTDKHDVRDNRVRKENIRRRAP